MEAVVSDHAIQRFRDHTRTKKSDDEVREKILEMFKKSTEVRYKKKSKNILAIIRHGFTEAKYFGYKGWIFVIIENQIATVYEDRAHRFSQA